ncbi:MAG TPA: hypothetical protein V6D22_19735 [Candidatus Obscuribacterales bacterium]
MVTATGELSNYFQGFDQLPPEQQNYIAESLALWVAAGYIDVLINNKMSAKVGRVNHGGSLADRDNRCVTLCGEELQTELMLFQKFGPLAKIPSRTKGFVEARLNLVAAHEMAHQIYTLLSPDTRAQIDAMHRNRVQRCDQIHPLPDGYDGNAELVTEVQLIERVFLSGYSRSSPEEYFAESLAAFSIKSSREKLKAIDAEIFELMHRLVFEANEMLDSKWHEQIARSQAERKRRQELTDTLLD